MTTEAFDSVDSRKEDPQVSAFAGGSGIRLENIRKTFGDGSIVACDDVSLDIAEDELLVLLGPSGCGKTTTLRIIAGLETADSGSILIDDNDVTNHKPKDRDLAFVFQDIALFPHMTVRRNIRFGLDMKSELSKEEKEKRVQEAAELLEISDLLDRKPSELSGGQQQRVSLGRAMVMEPAAFLLDEPFSALDANLRDQMRTEIKTIQRRLEKAMVFVTHDQEEAMTLGDQIVVMHNGNIMQKGSAHEIYNDPANKFVAEFIGSPSTNMLEVTVSRNGAEVVLKNEFARFDISDHAEAAEFDDGSAVIVGVRPEYLQINTDNAMFDAELVVIEPHGSEDAVYLGKNGIQLTAVTDAGEIDENQENVSVSIDPSDVWVFDGQGNRLI